MIELKRPYLLFLGDVADLVTAKTACGLRDWASDKVAGQWRTSANAVDLGLPEMDAPAARAAGIGSVIVGAAPAGGRLPPHWQAALAEAARAGIDVVSGLHSKLNDQPELVAAARAGGARLIDVRVPPPGLPVGTGQKRAGKRLLTVGADCALGKKYTALALTREMHRRGWNADFRATGQTGIMIAGGGVPLDAVVADFLAGAVEALTPAAAPDHWDVIEGQGSLFHPSYAGVTLGLIHGAQPDAVVWCHSLTRTELDDMPGFAMPGIAEGFARTVEAARLTNPAVRIAGIAVQTGHLGEAEARAALAALEDRHGVPAMDAMRFGVERVVDALA